MKSIKERAKEYIAQFRTDYKNEEEYYQTITDFRCGALSEREELTKWHDISEMPNHNNEVLCKLRYGGYDIVRKSFDSDTFIDCREENYDRTSDIIGWREIHE